MQLNLFATKQCSRCKRILPLSEFYKRGRNKDRKCYQCKKCSYEEHFKWIKKNKEKVKKNKHKYYQDHKKQYQEYCQDHKKEIKRQRREYRQSLRGKQLAIKYRQSEGGKRAITKWRQSEVGKRAIAKYRQSEAGKRKGEEEKARRRKLGFIPLNKFFPKSHFHHIDNKRGVYISAIIHRMFSNPSRKKHRQQVMLYYGNLDNMINQWTAL